MQIVQVVEPPSFRESFPVTGSQTGADEHSRSDNSVNEAGPCDLLEQDLSGISPVCEAEHKTNLSTWTGHPLCPDGQRQLHDDQDMADPCSCGFKGEGRNHGRFVPFTLTRTMSGKDAKLAAEVHVVENSGDGGNIDDSGPGGSGGEPQPPRCGGGGSAGGCGADVFPFSGMERCLLSPEDDPFRKDWACW